MKGKLLIAGLFVSLSSGPSIAANEIYCGEVQRTRVWAQGSDTYGIWIEYKDNPQACAGGFFIKNDADHKNIIYSTVLAAKAASQKICIQISSGNEMGNRCQVNYVMHE